MNHPKRKKPDSVSRPTPAEWLAVHLDVPPDLWADGMRVELRGRNALTVHGCRKILDYRPEEIRLAVKEAILTVQGARLVCTSYLAGAVRIDGRVNALVFTDTDGRDGEVEA